MKNKLTTIIPCKNEELNIRACIESVINISDELIIADSGSTDKTLDIAREYDCKIIEREYINSANFKNWAIPQAKYSWILIVDSDERATEELSTEILTILSETPKHDGYIIFRRNFFFGHHIKHCGWDKDNVLRLFKRDLSKYKEMRVHSEILVEGNNVGQLQGKFDHYTYWTFKQIMDKYDNYSRWAAEDMRDQGKKANLLSLFLAPTFRFVKHFFIQAGFLDGTKGFLVSAVSAYYVFLKYAKLWVMEKGKKRI